MSSVDPRRALPSIDSLFSEGAVAGWVERFGRKTVKASLREVLDEIRDGAPGPGGVPVEAILRRAEESLSRRARPSLGRVINGTGVVLHTNLGRARLADEAVAAQTRAAGYGNVEYSLAEGGRGSRYDHCAGVLCELTGAEAALVVNNNAAAVSLCVNEFALDREVVVSRGELVEIGGLFRIPDVVSRSGAHLREVGTTNRTTTDDFRVAVTDRTGLLLRVHPSNYRVEGFSSRPSLQDLAALAAGRGVPLVHDVGSGLLTRDLLPGFPPEPAVAESLAAGVDLVTLSGDKLLGGPQAGILVGRADLVAGLRRNPLLRAFRVDKTTLAALEATLMLYRDSDLAARRVPTLRMLRETADSVFARAAATLECVGAPSGPRGPLVTTVRTRAVVGGGSFPGFELESAGWAVGVDGPSPEAVAVACRDGVPPLIGRIDDGRFLIDVRTVGEGEEKEAASRLFEAISQVGGVE